MYRMSIFAVTVIAALGIMSAAALAHCGHCGVGDAAPAGHSEVHAEMHGALPDGHAMEIPMVCPGGCGMSGGLCGGCAPAGETFLRDMAVSFCPDCTDPDALCEMCEAGVEGAMDVLRGGIAPTIASAPAHEIAYVSGTLGGDMEAMFGSLMAAAGEQNLFGPNTHVGSVLPFALGSEGFNPGTTVYAGVSFDAGTEIAEPLGIFEVPGGTYMMVDHIGPYETLANTWMAGIAYAQMMGIEFGDGACGEHYVSDPESTPQEELLTQIFFPVVGHSDGRGEMPAGHPDVHSGHGE